MWVIHWNYALLLLLHNSTFTEILEFMCSDRNSNTFCGHAKKKNIFLDFIAINS